MRAYRGNLGIIEPADTGYAFDVGVELEHFRHSDEARGPASGAEFLHRSQIKMIAEPASPATRSGVGHRGVSGSRGHHVAQDELRTDAALQVELERSAGHGKAERIADVLGVIVFGVIILGPTREELRQALQEF